jgi:hypothetical protein
VGGRDVHHPQANERDDRVTRKRSRHERHDQRSEKRGRQALKRSERELKRLLERGLPEPEVNGVDLLAQPPEPEETDQEMS